MYNLNLKQHVIEGCLVNLRGINESDHDTIVRWRNDPDNNRFLNQTFKLTKELQHNWYINNYLPSNDLLFMFIDKKDGMRFGTIGLTDFNQKEQVGIAGRLLIGEKKYRSTPEMLEANLCFYDFLFNDLRLERVYCHIVKENKKAIALDSKLGFELNRSDTRFPQYLKVNNMEQHEMVMTQETFEKAKLRLKPIVDHYA